MTSEIAITYTHTPQGAPDMAATSEDAINGAGLWDPKKPYVFNPLLVVSRNRAEASLTVVSAPRKR